MKKTILSMLAGLALLSTTAGATCSAPAPRPEPPPEAQPWK